MYKILVGFFFNNGLCENLYYNEELETLTFGDYRILDSRYHDGFEFTDVNTALQLNTDNSAIGFALSNSFSKFLFYPNNKYRIVSLDNDKIIYEGTYYIGASIDSTPTKSDYFSYADYVRTHQYTDEELSSLNFEQLNIVIHHRPEYEYMRRDVAVYDIVNIATRCPKIVKYNQPQEYQFVELSKKSPDVALYTNNEKLRLMCLKEKPELIFKLKDISYKEIKSIENVYPKNWELFIHYLKTEFDWSEDECAQKAYEKEV